MVFGIMGILALFLFLLLFFLSSLVKNYLIKNSRELIGRTIDLKELHFNYAKASVQIKGLALYESNQADTFFSFTELYVNFDPWALIHNEYAISQISLIDPYLFVSQNKEHFNFDDLVQPAQSDDTGLPSDSDSNGTPGSSELAESVESVESAAPDKPVKPAEPTASAESVEPVAPVAPGEPVAPVAPGGLPDTTVSVKAAEFTDTALFRFTIRDIKIQGGRIIYEDQQIGNHLELNNLNLNTPIISWDSRQSDMSVNFRIGERGSVEIGAQVNNRDKQYTVTLNIQSISLAPARDYVKDYLDIRRLEGWLSSRITIRGDMEQVMRLSLSGNLRLDSLRITDGRDHELAGADRIEAAIRSIEVDSSRYHISSVILTHPVITATLDPGTTNIERVMRPFKITDSLAMAAGGPPPDSTATPLTYRIDTIRIADGEFRFTDQTLNRPFHYSLNQMEITMTGLTESARQVPVIFSADANRNGKLSGKMLLNMVDTMHLDLDMKINRMGLLSFSPYTEYFIASPITRGALDYDFSIHMTPQKLVNQNKIRIDKLELGRKTKDTTAIHVPVKLALYILKSPKGIIEIDLPVEGNPSDPKFSYAKILWKALANLFIKAAMSPFKLLSGLVSTNPDDLENLPLEYAQSVLNEQQQANLAKIAEIIRQKPELYFRFIQFTHSDKEKAQLALREIKTNYIQSSDTAVTHDPAHLNRTVSALSSTDTRFVDYLRTRIPQVDSIGIETACLRLISPAELQDRLNSLMAERNRQLKHLLVDGHGINPEMIEIQTVDMGNIPEELRFPHFKIEVSTQ